MKLSEQIQEALQLLDPLLQTTHQQGQAPTTHQQGTTPSAAQQGAAPTPRPHTVLILGTGLDSLAAAINEHFSISYSDIPHCKAPRVPGHQGRLIIGELAGQQVICLQGRLHIYEGNTPLETVFPLVLAHALGARRLILTNAAGAINKTFAASDFMLITDHINFTGMSPVTFDKNNDVANTFADMTHAYTPSLNEQARSAARELGCTLQEGVYIGVRGPTFETPAEIRAFRTLGADAVGMSTVHEAIMASALGMEVCGISLLTNMAAGILGEPITVEEVNSTSAAHTYHLGRLIEEIIKRA